MASAENKSRPNDLYEVDFFAWTQEQARLLRERRFGDLDLDNLVDEVEGVGSSDKREIRNRLKVLLAHLLKWKHHPGRRGPSWRRTVREQRDALADILEKSPSLRSYFIHAVSGSYAGASVSASEDTGLASGIFPEECPFSPDEILDLSFFPEDPANE